MNKISGSNITIMVKDMDAAISFYENIGLMLKNRWDNHYAMIDAPGITIGVHPAGDRRNLNSGSLSIGFITESIEDARTLLENHSISYRTEEGKSGDYLHFEDPDGTLLYFVQPKW